MNLVFAAVLFLVVFVVTARFIFMVLQGGPRRTYRRGGLLTGGLNQWRARFTLIKVLVGAVAIWLAVSQNLKDLNMDLDEAAATKRERPRSMIHETGPNAWPAGRNY